MLIRLSEVRMKELYPEAKGLDFDKYYLVDTKFRDGSVYITVRDTKHISQSYLLEKGDYIAKEEPCEHTFTDKEGKCIECGEHIWAMETRPCEECECFHEKPYKGWLKCGKHLCDVYKDGKVRYAVKDGTCFESGELNWPIVLIDKNIKVEDEESILTTETRPCGECANFGGNPGEETRCSVFLMEVNKDDQVCYKTEEGTCFEAKDGV
jgi:hypothetical protein